MTFDEWFDRDIEWWEIPEDCGDRFRDVAKAAWDAATAWAAATEEVKKDHDKIGKPWEEV